MSASIRHGGHRRSASIAGDHLRSFIERIERLEEERAALGGDIREVYAEAKSQGFDAPTMRRVVRLRRLTDAERREAEALLDVYLHALGMAPQGELFGAQAGPEAPASAVAALLPDGVESVTISRGKGKRQPARAKAGVPSPGAASGEASPTSPTRGEVAGAEAGA